MAKGTQTARLAPLALGLALAACSGDVASPDVGASDTFVWDTVPIVDAPRADVSVPPPPADAAPAPDLPPAADGAPDGAPGRCAEWSAWTCDDSDPVLLCKASCAAGPLALSCINSGDCVCGIATGSCGRFVAPSPCEVCRAAVGAGCCNP